jgi:hypothetical protein
MIKCFVSIPSNVGTAADWKLAKGEMRGTLIPVVAESNAFGDKFCIAEFWVEPVGSKNTDKKFLSGRARARMTKKLAINLTDKFRSWLALPHLGGDQYKVKVAKIGDKGNALETDVFETWRRIYLHVHHMNAAALRMFNQMKPTIEAVFKKSFIDVKWEPSAPTRTLVDEPWTPADVVHMPHLYDAARSRLTRKPFHMRLVIVNDIFDKVTRRYRKNVSKGDLSRGDYRLDTREPLGYTANDSGCANAWVQTAATDPWVEVTEHVRKIGPRRLALHLHRNPAVWRDLKAGNTLKLVVDTRERNHGFCGYSLDNFCTVRTNEPGGLVTVLQTFTHEVGHSLGQAVDKEDVYDVTTGNKTGEEANANWHADDHGGQGPHCHFHAQRVVANAANGGATTSGHTYVWQAGDLCTMFFRDDSKVDKKGAFCQECEPRLKRVDMSPAAMRGGRRTTWPPHPSPNWDHYS